MSDQTVPAARPGSFPSSVREYLGATYGADIVRRLRTRPVLVEAAAWFAVAWLIYAWINHGRPANLDYFVPLADALLNGRLGLVDPPSWLNEVVPWSNGLSYVVYPPAPAILLLPAVLVFGPGFEQAWASIVLGAANVALMTVVLRGMGLATRPRLALTIVFAVGSIGWYSAQAGSSWHFAHVVATLFMLLAIRACQLDARTAIIGFLFAAAVMARLPVVLAAPFFAAYLADRSWRATSGTQGVFGSLLHVQPRAWKARFEIGRYLRAAIPFGAAAAALMVAYLAYNAARFGTPLENGYWLIPGIPEEYQYRHGFFSVLNIPRMLYAMFLSGPVQAPEFPWIQSRHLGGLSILLTTPLFLWVVKARHLDWFGVGAWAAIGLVMIPILTHADPGGAQFGFRYAQDIYPFLFLLVARGLAGRMSFEAWLAIGIGLGINAWGMGSTYFNWWA
jgi:hypothetical protein